MQKPNKPTIIKLSIIATLFLAIIILCTLTAVSIKGKKKPIPLPIELGEPKHKISRLGDKEKEEEEKRQLSIYENALRLSQSGRRVFEEKLRSDEEYERTRQLNAIKEEIEAQNKILEEARKRNEEGRKKFMEELMLSQTQSEIQETEDNETPSEVIPSKETKENTIKEEAPITLPSTQPSLPETGDNTKEQELQVQETQEPPKDATTSFEQEKADIPSPPAINKATIENITDKHETQKEPFGEEPIENEKQEEPKTPSRPIILEPIIETITNTNNILTETKQEYVPESPEESGDYKETTTEERGVTEENKQTEYTEEQDKNTDDTPKYDNMNFVAPEETPSSDSYDEPIQDIQEAEEPQYEITTPSRPTILEPTIKTKKEINEKQLSKEEILPSSPTVKEPTVIVIETEEEQNKEYFETTPNAPVTPSSVIETEQTEFISEISEENKEPKKEEYTKPKDTTPEEITEQENSSEESRTTEQEVPTKDETIKDTLPPPPLPPYASLTRDETILILYRYLMIISETSTTIIDRKTNSTYTGTLTIIDNQKYLITPNKDILLI